ncbi:hypothetical protein MMSP_5451 [Mycobacterium sp. 012931]|nr:hypothetical protein MMSP_5451 [Mycobacterium sp. 012931]
MIGDILGNRGDRDQLLVADQPVEQLGVVQHAVVAAQLPVFLAQGVEAVWAGDDDLAVDGRHALEDAVEGLDGLLGQLLEQELVAGPAGGVTVAGLPGAQHHELHTRGGEQLGDGLGGLLGLVVVGAGATHPEQVLVAVEAIHVLAVDRDIEVDFVDPVGPVRSVLAPRIALVLQVLEQHRQLGGELRLHHHLVAAHIDDVIDVLDVHRALFDAGAAAHAGPQHVGIDDTTLFGGTDQRARGLLGTVSGHPAEAGFGHVVAFFGGGLEVKTLERIRGLLTQDVGRLGHPVVAQVHDDQLGRQRLAGIPGRTL